jgi:endonuclease/exonuclease/phosphatase family metal-dependent hydrolase
VEVVHPPHPTDPPKIAEWERTLAALPPAGREGDLRVLAGDFNATLDNSDLRDVIDRGYVDAADAAGAGLTTTYPGRFIFPITIDHVLADRRIEVADVDVEKVPGTDHRAVIATLVLPRQ